MSNYEKYLKYKNKYIKLKNIQLNGGGLNTSRMTEPPAHQIQDEELARQIQDEELASQIHDEELQALQIHHDELLRQIQIEKDAIFARQVLEQSGQLRGEQVSGQLQREKLERKLLLEKHEHKLQQERDHKLQLARQLQLEKDEQFAHKIQREQFAHQLSYDYDKNDFENMYKTIQNSLKQENRKPSKYKKQINENQQELIKKKIISDEIEYKKLLQKLDIILKSDK